jgi:hypothetical protein
MSNVIANREPGTFHTAEEAESAARRAAQIYSKAWCHLEPGPAVPIAGGKFSAVVANEIQREAQVTQDGLLAGRETLSEGTEADESGIEHHSILLPDDTPFCSWQEPR